MNALAPIIERTRRDVAARREVHARRRPAWAAPRESAWPPTRRVPLRGRAASPPISIIAEQQAQLPLGRGHPEYDLLALPDVARPT